MIAIPVGIALGSNLGDSHAELDAAIAFLRSLALSGKLIGSSRISTEPVDCPPNTPPFLNAVAEIEIDPGMFPPQKLLRCLQAFEQERGRPRVHDVNSPRTLDLDILYYGDLMLHEPDLIIPHPRAHLRRFVLEPLAQIRPDLILPGQTKTVRELLADT